MFAKDNYEGNMSKFLLSTLSADGLAPSGARTSAGTVMTKSGPRRPNVWGHDLINTECIDYIYVAFNDNRP